ncbi:MAG: N-acetylmuramoyl-L-alanine amidase [Methyloligellaceae bacterium]
MSLKTDSPFADIFIPSPNFEPRKGEPGIDLLLLHYTATETSTEALQWLTNSESKVSSHYLIGENGGVVQMVHEKDRAWHAGDSYWDGEADINSCSIGVEIQNLGHDHDLPDFPDVQMTAVVRLCLDIVSRHKIPPHRVLAHSDVAPHRKRDPGECFDWARLYRAGIGLWVAPSAPVDDVICQIGDSSDAVREIQSILTRVGYKVNQSGTYDEETEQAVAAFQRHFRQQRVDGAVDQSTRETMDRLLSAVPNSANLT